MTGATSSRRSRFGLAVILALALAACPDAGGVGATAAQAAANTSTAAQAATTQPKTTTTTTTTTTVMQSTPPPLETVYPNGTVVPPCARNCTGCAQRAEPFRKADPACASCSRLEPEQAGQVLGSCVMLGPHSAMPKNGPTTGGYAVTLTGEFFGASSDAPGLAARIGDTQCGALKWLSRTSISCRVPAGVGTPPVSVKVGSKGDGSWTGQCVRCGEFVAMPASFSYDRPTILLATQPLQTSRPPAGGFPVTLIGSGFGTFDSGQVTGLVSSFYGGDWTASSYLWTSDTMIIVSAPPGVGSARPVSVQVGGQKSDYRAGAVIDYDAPAVKKVLPALAPREGGRRVTLRGVGLGPAPPGRVSKAVENGGGQDSGSSSSDTGQKNGTAAQATSSNSTVAGRTANATNAMKGLDVNDSNVSSSSSNITNQKQQQAFWDASQSSGVDSDGSMVRVSAKGITATLGKTACQVTEWISQTSATCVTPRGSGSFVPVQVMAGGQWSPVPDIDDDLWHAPTFSFVGSSVTITALLSKTPSQYEIDGGHNSFADTLAARILTQCMARSPKSCGKVFRDSQVMFTAEATSYFLWCKRTPGCVLPPAGARRRANSDDSQSTHEDRLLHLLRHRSDSVGSSTSEINAIRSIAAQEEERAGAVKSGEEASVADLPSSTVVEFRLLGSEYAPESHHGTLGLFYEMGLEGTLWTVGIRAIKIDGREWEVAARDCPRGDRYNDMPCEGRGACISGACICPEEFSGEWCQIEASFSEEFMMTIGHWSRLLGGTVLGLSVMAHFLSWTIAGGFFATSVLVAGDFISIVESLQFIALTTFLDTSLPVQYFDWASYFRIFTLQLDPKHALEAFGIKWHDFFPMPLTNACYSEQAPEYHPRATLMTSLAGGAAKMMSQDSTSALNTSYLPKSADIAFGDGRRVTRDRRIVIESAEKVEGWGGNVGHDPHRGDLEVSFRLFVGTLVCCYGLLLVATLGRLILASCFNLRRRAGYRRKMLARFERIEKRDIKHRFSEATSGKLSATAQRLDDARITATASKQRSDKSMESIQQRKEKNTEYVSGCAFGPKSREDVAGGHSGEGADDHGLNGDGQVSEEENENEEGQYERIFDPSVQCGACREVGHKHTDCDRLEELLIDKRSPFQRVPDGLHFPRWEVPIMIFVLAGVCSSTGAVLGSAGPAGCRRMYSVVLALLPLIAFQIYIFWRSRENIGRKGRQKVWFRPNQFGFARMERQILGNSRWPRSTAKSRSDYYDALFNSGWWEEALVVSETKIKDGNGIETVVRGGGFLPEKTCKIVMQRVVDEAMLVPALFLRSRDGMEAADEAQDLTAFLEVAKERLRTVVLKTADKELRRLGMVEPTVILHWSESATEVLWPGNQDCYRRAIYEGEQPDSVPVSSAVRSYLTKSLQNIKGAAKTDFADPEGKFLQVYRGLYKRFAGSSDWQVHYLSINLAVRFSTALILSLFSGVWQSFVLVIINSFDLAVLVGFSPYKNRLQNAKQLLQTCLRTFVLLMSFMRVPREGVENNEAANEATFVVILLTSVVIDSISPIIGSVRGLIGIFFVVLRLHRRERVMAHLKTSAVVRFFIGVQRNRTSVYLRPFGYKRSSKHWNERRMTKRAKRQIKKVHDNVEEIMNDDDPDNDFDETQLEAIKSTDYEDWKDAIALQKWISVHIYPRVVAMGVEVAGRFCANHLGTEEAHEDLFRAETVDNFLLLCKEHFFKVMMENMLLVLPAIKVTSDLCEEPNRPLIPEMRETRQPRPPPPWFRPRTRKTAQLLLSKHAWHVAEECWKKVTPALKGQLLTWEPGSSLDEHERLLPQRYEFGMTEAEVHQSLPRTELPEIVALMSKVLPDDMLYAAQGAFQGDLHVTVLGIKNFTDCAGFMDKTDPYVQLQLGDEIQKTSVKDNAGGTVSFNETLKFQKELGDNTLIITVMDEDTTIDDTLGEIKIDLRHEDLTSTEPVTFQLTKRTSKHSKATVGQVLLVFNAIEAKTSHSGKTPRSTPRRT